MRDKYLTWKNRWCLWEKKIKESNLIVNLNKKDSANLIEWICLGILMGIAFLSFYYLDISCTVDNSILLLKSIIKGDFFHYYDFCIGKTSTVWAPNYEILMYLIFAIWNIPLAAVKYFFDIDYLYSMPAILWTKLLLFLCLLVMVHTVYKICIILGMSRNRARLSQFLLLSSVNIMVPTMMISQCDIINLMFIILGIYMYLKRRKWKFILCFAMAIPLKMFALFIFVPLVLLDEKKIVKALFQIVLGLGILIGCKAISWQSEAYHYLIGSFSNAMIEQLQSNGIDLGLGSYVWFIGGVVIICIWVYMKNIDNEERSRYIIYIPFAVFSCMFALFPFFPYWIVLLAPFSILNIMMNPKWFKLNVLLETLGGLTGFFTCVNYYYWVYSYDTVRYLIISKLPWFNNGENKYEQISEIFKVYGLDRFSDAVFTVFVVALIAMLVINYPRKKNAKEYNVEKVEHSIIWVRLLALGLIITMWGSIGIIKKDEAVFDTENSQNYVIGKDSLMVEGNYIKQVFKAEKTGKVAKIDIKFYNEATSHINVSTVECSIRECDTGKILFSKNIGTSMIESDENYLVNVGIEVVKGKEYEIILKGNNCNGQMITPYLTENLQYEEYPVIINGEEKRQNLYVKVILG